MVDFELNEERIVKRSNHLLATANAIFADVETLRIPAGRFVQQPANYFEKMHTYECKYG